MRPLRLSIPLLVLGAMCVPGVAAAGTLTGRVTDLISGAPLQGILVGVGPVGHGSREYTETDADGTWSIDEPQAGRYTACFFPGSGMNLLRRCRRDETVGFYGEPIDVPAEGTVGGIDAVMAPGSSVTGIVTGWDGKPLPGVCVSAWTPNGGWLRAGDALTPASGRYTIIGLTPGVVNKVVFAPVDSFEGHCAGGIDDPGFVSQWFDRRPDIESATSLSAAPSEMVAGVDGSVGPSATPPGSTPSSPSCVVPALRHRTYAFARTKLAQAGCSTPMPALKRSLSFRRGSVIATRPAARTRMRRGRRVTLTVSRGR
jgi:hypothetical protein